MAETRQQYQGMHPITRSVQKNNAKNMLAMQKPTPEVHQEGVDEAKKLQKVKDAINSVQNHTQLTPEQKKAIVAGTTRAWYADLPGAPADIVGMGVDYLTEGLKTLLPSGDMAGYDVAKSLGLNAVQEGARDPFLGSKQLEEFGENVGYIPPTTGTDLETYARIGAGFFDPVPIPMTAGVFASNRAKNLPKMSLAKAQKMEKGFNKNAKYPLTPYTKQEIFDDTGFFKGPEGEWRFEISDKDMKVNQEFLKTKTDLWGNAAVNGPGYDLGQTYGRLGDAIDHPELFKAYPELEDVYLKFIPPGSDIRGMSGLRGSYNDAGEMVPISNTPPGGFKTAGAAYLAEKVPEKYAKVIMVVAPTRQQSIKNLQFIVDEANLDVSLGAKRVELAKSVIAEAGDNQKMTSLGELNYSSLDSAQVMLDKAQDTLKINLPELERLKAGGQPDLKFSVKSTLTHEIQHAIQGIEGLPRGGNTQTAYRETQDAAIAPILEKAQQKDPKLFDEFALSQEVAKFDDKMQNMAMMDDVRYLQQLQKFIMSDKPTRNAKFVENTSFSYGLTQKENNLLGVRPSKRKTKEYADYLRKKARLFQDKVIDKYLAGPQGKYSQKQAEFRDLLGDLYQYTEKAGAKAEKMPVDFALEKADSGLSFFRKGNAFDPQTIGEVEKVNGFYAQPNWLALGEKNIKNYVKRLARDADKHREAAGMKRQIESKLTELENQRREYQITGRGGDFEFYQRLAGEAEARAVQKRLELRVDLPVSSDIRKVPTELYDVPLNELAITGQSRSVAAKNQAKANAQSILDQPSQMNNLTKEAKKYKTADEFVKSQEQSYMGGHTAPYGEDAAPLHDLTQLYPDDIYNSDAVRYYGDGSPMDADSARIIQEFRGNPEAEVTIYRAVPGDYSVDTINPGDWVTINREYAEQHGNYFEETGALILSKKVKAKEVFTDANSIHEFGYNPSEGGILSSEELTKIWNKAN